MYAELGARRVSCRRRLARRAGGAHASPVQIHSPNERAGRQAGGHRPACGSALIYQRVVEQQPLAEDIYRRLITCLLALEQRGEAYEGYRRCRQQLSVLLGITPSTETDALVASLRNCS